MNRAQAQELIDRRANVVGAPTIAQRRNEIGGRSVAGSKRLEDRVRQIVDLHDSGRRNEIEEARRSASIECVKLAASEIHGCVCQGTNFT
jgi:hypothetical protein